MEVCEAAPVSIFFPESQEDSGRIGVVDHVQGSSFVATLRYLTESLWDSEGLLSILKRRAIITFKPKSIRRFKVMNGDKLPEFCDKTQKTFAKLLEFVANISDSIARLPIFIETTLGNVAKPVEIGERLAENCDKDGKNVAVHYTN